MYFLACHPYITKVFLLQSMLYGPCPRRHTVYINMLVARLCVLAFVRSVFFVVAHPSSPLCHSPPTSLSPFLSSAPTAEVSILSVTPLCPFSLEVVWEVLDHDEIYAHPEEVCYIVMLQRSDGSQPAMNRTVTNVTLMENITVVSCNCTVYVGTMNEPHLFIKSRCYIVLLTMLDMLEPIPDLIICALTWTIFLQSAKNCQKE